MAYIGNTNTTQAFTPAIDYFNGNGSTTAFTLSRPVASVAQVQAIIENVPQNPGDAFTVSGNTITFTSAPPSGTNNIYVYYTSPITQVIQPGQGTVAPTQIENNYALWNKSGSDINYTAGNVGIGTSSPTRKLSVGGTSEFSSTAIGEVRCQRTAGTNQYIDFGTNDTAGGQHYVFGYGNYPLILATNQAERMRIDSSGIVTIPYQPAFRATLGATQTYSFTGSQDILPSFIYLNRGSHYNAANGRFTAPVTGAYCFQMGLVATNAIAEGFLVVEAKINGAVNYQAFTSSSYSKNQESGISASTVVSLNAGDYIVMNVYSNQSVTLGDAGAGYSWQEGRTYFSGFLIG
jgi:hypothetical protein